MPRRAKIDLLPEDVRKEFQALLMARAFSDYTAFEAWFAEKGYEISKSSAHRWGKGFQRSQAAIKASTDMAQALAENLSDEDGKTLDAMQRLYLGKLFQVMVDMEDLDPEKIDFMKLGRVIADMTRSAIPLKKLMAENAKKTLEEAATVVGESAKKQGVSDETIQTIRRDLFKMAG
ncbi:MAG TPA: DUF3486 family protein [Acidobacteriota bacterium]|nr:DUF3486 family protein [Acidobacteriota bacterium]